MNDTIAANVKRFSKRGRLLTVDGVQWRWKCSKRGSVIAYSELGERRCAASWKVCGVDPDTFDRGQSKRTSDGMVKPSNVAKWISTKQTP